MEHNYQIISVDFDGTLYFSKWPDCGEPNQALINYLTKWKSNGNKLILWTCRIGDALSNAVKNTDLNSMPSMTTFRKLWNTMAAIAGRLPVTDI